jgi:hypothetical protein
VKKTEDAAVESARDLARVSTSHIFLKDAKTGEWWEINGSSPAP